MIVNRYTAPVQWAQYNPMSMQELAYAPQFLRQRHDMAQQGLADLEQASNEYDVLDQYSPIAGELVQPFQQSVQGLAEQLASQGVNRSQAIPQAMKLKSQYQQLFGQQGAIGQLQARTQQYREQAKQIQDFFKNNPELARGALRELQAGEAKVGPDGRLQLGEMGTPNYVRHYDAKEVNDILNSQIDNIKDTLIKDFGFSRAGSISSIQDVYVQGQEMGRSFEDVTNILMSQLSPEIINSARQYGRYVIGDEAAGVANLMQQIQGAALGRARTERNTRYNVFTNEDRKSALANLSGMDTLQLPGARLETLGETPFSNLVYQNNRIVSKDKNSMSSKINDPAEITKYNYYNEQGQPVEATMAVQYVPGSGPGAPGFYKVKPGFRREVIGTDVANIEREFLQLKESNPVLRNMSNEKALKHVQDYYKNLGQTFATQDVFKTNMDFVRTSLRNNAQNADFIDTKGRTLNLSQLASDMGMTQDELVKAFEPSGTGIRPQIGAVVEGSVTNKRGERVPIFMKPDRRTDTIASTATDIVNHLYNGGGTGEVITKYIDPKTGEAVAGVRTYIVNDYQGDPVVIFTGAQLTPEHLEQMTKNKSKQAIQAMFEPGAANVMGVSEVFDLSRKRITNTLQGTKF